MNKQALSLAAPSIRPNRMEVSFDYLQHHSLVFRQRLKDFYREQAKDFVPLNEDELNQYCWEQLRSCDEDHDEKAIEEKFKYYRTLNENDPIRLRIEYLDWNGYSI